MDFKDPENAQLLTWMLIGVVSTWGGIVRYIMDIKKEKVEWRWLGVFIQIVVSGFTGVLGGLVSVEMSSSIYMTCAIAGLFGAMGSGAIELIANRLLNKNGVK